MAASLIARSAVAGVARRLRLIGLLLCVALWPSAASAQSVDPDLWGVDPDGTVLAVVRHGNTIYLGGSFTHLSPTSGAGVPFDASTGRPLPRYPKVAGYVWCVIPDGTGGWYLGGRFWGVGGLPRRNLAHILRNGDVDDWAPDPDGEVRALALSGRVLYVGGEFARIAAEPRANIAALRAASGRATSWNPGTDYGVDAILVQGRSVYIGGQFWHAAGEQRFRLAELDAASARATPWKPDPDDRVFALAAKGDLLFAGGVFKTVGSTERKYLAAFERSTGSLLPWDARVDRIPEFKYDGGPRVVSLIVDGETLYVAGVFSQIGGAERQGLAALQAGTARATDWDPQAVRGFLPAIFFSMALDGTSLFVGGSFDSLGGLAGSLAGAVDTRTGRALPWRPDVNHGVTALAAQHGTLYAGGWFTSIGPRVQRHALAAVDARTGVVTDWDPEPNGLVNALGVRDGVVYAGGSFSVVGGLPRANLAAVDSASGSATDWNPSADGSVWSLTVTDSTVYAGGWFWTMGGQPRWSLAAVERGSGLVTDWRPDPNDIVTTIAPAGDRVFVGGMFSAIGGATRVYAAAVDRDSGRATPWTADASDYVRCIAVNDTMVYVAGYLNYIGGVVRDGIAQVSARTGLATPWMANASREVKQVLVSDGVVYAGGAFSSIGGQPRDCIAALDPLTGAVLDWNPGTDGVVWALGAGEGRIYAGGAFQRMGASPASLFASITPATRGSATGGSVPSGPVVAMSTTNPADAEAVLRFTLRTAATAELNVYDLSGRRRTEPLAGAALGPGPQSVAIDTRDWEPGCYFLRLSAGSQILNRKFVVVH